MYRLVHEGMWITINVTVVINETRNTNELYGNLPPSIQAKSNSDKTIFRFEGKRLVFGEDVVF